MNNKIAKGTRRRHILCLSGSALTGGLAGCTEGLPNTSESSSDPEGERTEPESTPEDSSDSTQSTVRHEFKSPPYENVETTVNESSTNYSGEIVLEEGQYAQLEFQLEETTQMNITGSKENDGSIDLFLLSPESEYSEYQERGNLEFPDEFTKIGIESVEQSVELSSGDYFFVIDNTAVYGSEPEGAIEFEFELVLETGTKTPSEDQSEQEKTPSQPKIREITDNMGHTFTISDDDYPGEPVSAVRVDDEVVVKGGLQVELCVTEVAAQSDNEITYSYRFGNTRSEHADNPEEDRIDDNCWRWEMQRSDYQSEWGFRIWIRNEDDIYYQNDSVESDYRVDIYYTNLSLEE